MASRSQQRQVIHRARQARTAAAKLAACLDRLSQHDDIPVTPAGGEALLLPSRAADLLVEILHDFGEGRDPCVLPNAIELSTAQLANLLGVSPQYVQQLLTDGKIPFEHVDGQPYVHLHDAVRYL